tara:strand:- start:146 stop:772 length:627 start_codon:yes stop_codon:yes gene_type:complete
MANIKMKDLLKEFTSTTGFVSKNPWVKEHDDTPNVNIKELVSSIQNYGSLGEHIYGKGSLKEIAETLSSIADGASQHTLSETDDMFDKVTISRNMKELTGLSKQFSKVAGEANSLQERMSGLYEDMGNILGRYYEIGEDKMYRDGDELDDKDDEEGAPDFKEDDGYKAFFNKALKKWGASSPDDIPEDDKKEFYDYVDRNWKADKETD